MDDGILKVTGSPADVPPGPRPGVRTTASRAGISSLFGFSALPVFAGGHGADGAAVAPGVLLGGRYRYVRELGRGALGVVVLVVDEESAGEIALKLIDPEVAREHATVVRLMHEVRCARKLAHENVVRVHDFVTVDGVEAIAMEYFASYPLTRLIRSRLHRQPARGLAFARAAARALIAAHQADIVHRDVQPANLLVNHRDQLKAVDFGLSAALGRDPARAGGAASYMSPEQVRGLSVDSRTDIYSLGVVMYEMFTGTVPYAADSTTSVLHRHLEGAKEPPRRRNPLLAPALEAIILKAMAVRPDERYQTARELLAALDALDLREAA